MTEQVAPPPAPVPVDQAARERVAALVVELMLRDGVPPHVLVGALLANVAMLCCSTANKVLEAYGNLRAAERLLHSHRATVPVLYAKAAAGRAAANNSGAIDGAGQPVRQ